MLLILALSLFFNVDVAQATTSQSNTSSVTISQVTSAATSVTKYYNSNKKLPNYITISNKQITLPQFLYLLASATSRISSGSSTSITVRTVSKPTTPTEKLTAGNIYKSESVSLSNSLKKYIETNSRIPNYLPTSRGKMKFESAVLMYSKILNFYSTNHRLPNYVAVSAWTGANYTETTDSNVIMNVSHAQLITAATNLKSYIERNNQITSTVTIGTQKITITQFLHLLARSLVNIYGGKTSTLTTAKVYSATTPTENISSGNIQKAEYIKMAQTLISFASTNSKIPNYFNTTLGKMRYESALYLFLKAVTFYNTNNRLPTYISVTPWTGKIGSGTTVRPVYIISDIINNASVDNARINAIVNALKNLGVPAYNYGAGTNNIDILKNSNIPINALIIEICGGACAGTINEMGTSWYKSLKGTREVFLVFTEGATKITGLDWLPRAHDDNFDPPEFLGLAHPDEYLLKNGYNYYEGYTNTKLSELVKILFNEANT